MKIARRGWFVVGALSAMLGASMALRTHWLSAAPTPAAPTGQLDEQSLGTMLSAMGLTPTPVDQRLDFTFKAVRNGQEWDLTMTTVLSQDKKSIWVMAWLDELPKTAAEVPRTALLRLLAENDRMGNGKFFAYIPTNRRFVLERVVENRNLDTASFREVLSDVGASVIDSHSLWAVANWNEPPLQQVTTSAPAANVAPTANASPAANSAPNQAATRSTLNAPKFQPTNRK
jgi:hypothetical protein